MHMEQQVKQNTEVCPQVVFYKYECSRDVDYLWLFLMKDVVITQAL